MLKKIWNDPVGSKIISALVIGVNASAIYTWWANILWVMASIWAFLVSKTPVPNGIIILGSALILAFLVAAILIGLAALKGHGDSIEAYRTDNFEGLMWRWEYGARNEITNLCPFCPTCDYQIIPHNASGYALAHRMRFSCDVCNRTLLERDEPMEMVEARVSRLIHRQIRMKLDQAKPSV